MLRLSNIPTIGSSLITLETSSLKMTLRLHDLSEEPSSTRENLTLSSGFVGGTISRKNVALKLWWRLDWGDAPVNLGSHHQSSQGKANLGDWVRCGIWFLNFADYSTKNEDNLRFWVYHLAVHLVIFVQQENFRCEWVMSKFSTSGTRKNVDTYFL